MSVSPASDTSTAVVSLPDAIATAISTVNSAQTVLDTAISSANTGVTAVVDTPAKLEYVQSKPEVTAVIESATAAIDNAHQTIQAAETAITVATQAQAAAETQTVVVAVAQTQVDVATETKDSATQDVADKTVIVEADTTAVATAQSTADSSTITVTTNGVTATVYSGTGRTPALPSANQTPILTTTVPQIAFNWGSGSVMGGPSERVIVKFEGTITVPEEAVAVKYAVSSDDGSMMYIDGQLAINNWRDQGTAWSPYSPTYNTTTDKQQDFVIWYYENGGGATCTLGWLIWRADGSGYFTTPGASAFGTTTTTQDPSALVALEVAQQNLTTANQNLTVAQENLTVATQNLTTAQQNLTTETTSLTGLQSIAQATQQTASSLSQSALDQALQAKTSLETAVSVITQTIEAKLTADRLAAEAAAAKAAAEAQAAAEAKAAAEARAAKAEADRVAAEAAAAKAEADRVAAEAAAAKAAADKAAADAAAAKAAEEKAAAEVAAAKAEADAKAAADAAAKAEADKAKAEAEAKAQADSDAKAAADKAAAEAAAKEQAAADAKAEADAKAAEAAAAAQAAANAKAEADKAAADKEAADKAAKDAIGVIPNNPDQLPTDVPKEAPKEVLVAHIQVDKPGVENGGIEFFGTKTAPQVVGEDGNLTPPAPPPGSGLPIPPDAITTTDTFIGQPGGTTFNAPDIAVPVELVPVEIPAALDVIPGVGAAAQAVNQAYVALANIGNDMSPITRKKAKKILVLTTVIAAVRRRFGS